MASNNFDLDTPLFNIHSKDADTSFTIRHAVQGIQVFGGIGSGKTSGSGKLIAMKYLKANFGGLVLTCKEGEVDSWVEYCRSAGRSNDLIIVEPGRKNYFNFLEYESLNNSRLAYADNIFQVLKTVIKASEDRTSSSGNDQFWENALDQFMINTISLCLMAYKKVSVQLLYDIAATAPRMSNKREVEQEQKITPFKSAITEARNKVKKELDAWKRRHLPDKLETLSNEEYQDLLDEEVPDFRALKILDQFFMESLYSINEKTRSIIDFCFSGFLFRLLRDPVYTLFCRRRSTFTPEDSLHGKIIIINLPAKIYQKVGQDCQIMFKYIFQRAMERRNIEDNGRPVFLFADESHHFLHPYDAEYQATARSSRIATIYLTQNLANYYSNMGGEQSENKVTSFLGTLGTKIFHANAELETNKMASSLIGEAYQREESEATCSNDGKVSVTTTISSQLKKIVRPEDFFGLRTGGPENKFIVSAYIHMQGKRLANGFNHQKISINQNQNF